MLEKLIEQLAVGQSQAIASAEDATKRALLGNGLVHLPSDYTRHDVEAFMPERRRMRGTMKTSVIEHFAAYAKKHAEPGASVFIDPETMQASAVLNLGTKEAPGHCDHRAVLVAKQTAPFKAMKKIANGMPLTQQAVAEFCEDWSKFLEFYKDGALVDENKHAIAAIRRITIEGLRKVEASEQSLSATRSTFESVTASSQDPLPTELVFGCSPYHGIKERDFSIRLAVITGDKPMLTLRLVNMEMHEEQIAEELAERIASQFDDAWADRVLLGTHSSP